MSSRSDKLDKLHKWDMTGRVTGRLTGRRGTMDTRDTLGSMEWMGIADNWVSMGLMDFVVYIPAEYHHRQQSLQHHHLDVHRLHEE